MKLKLALLSIAFSIGVASSAHAQSTNAPGVSRALLGQPNGVSLLGSDGTIATPQNTTLTNNSQVLPQIQFYRSGIVPSDLVHFNATSTPTVCLIGDSTGAIDPNYPNSLSKVDHLWDYLQKRIVEDNPGKTITFKNFSIAGSAWASYLVPWTFTFPSWYTNTANTWSSYVAPAGCTTIFVNWGINDTYNLTPLQVKNVLTTLVGYSPSPDIILITNKNTNPLAGAPYGTFAFQNGTVSAAMLERSVALTDGAGLGITGLPHIGLIDTGRLFTEGFNGYDPVIQHMVSITLPTGTVTSFPYTLPATIGGDYDFTFSFTGQATTMTGSAIQVTTGTTSTALVQITDTAGNFTACYYIGAGISSTCVTGPTWTAASLNNVEVIMKGENEEVWDNGVLIMNLYEPRMSSPNWAPQLRISSPPASPVATLTQYLGSLPLSTPGYLTPVQVWGTTANTDGNGLNHDAAWALALFDQRALDGTVFGQ